MGKQEELEEKTRQDFFFFFFLRNRTIYKLKQLKHNTLRDNVYNAIWNFVNLFHAMG
jgi:hypothetical protein